MNSSVEVLATLKLRNLIPDEMTDDMANSYILQAETEIKEYCNIPEKALLPSGMFYAWVEVSNRLINQEESKVTAITEGDTTIRYKDTGVNNLFLGLEATLKRRLP